MTEIHFLQHVKRFVRRFRIRTKLIVVFLAISMASVTAVAFAINYQTSITLAESVDANLKSYASNEGIAAGNLLLHQMDLLESLTLNEILITKITLANSLYDDEEEVIIERLMARDVEWETAVETDRLPQIVLTNTAADELWAFRRRFPDHLEIFITDRYGALLAATNMTTDYYQADEAWWQRAYNVGEGSPSINAPQFDESAQSLGLALAVPIYDRDRQTIIGILRTTYDLRALGNLLDLAASEQDQLYLDLLLPDNQVISTKTLLQGDYEAAGVTAVALDESVIYQLKYEPLTQITLDGIVYLATLSPLTTIDTNPHISELDWNIIARQERQTALALVISQRRTIWFLSIIIMGIAVVGALFASQLLAQPILRLTDAAQQIRDGNLNVQAPVTSKDEVGELAETFNEMAARLRRVIKRLEEHRGQLEHRVAERTAELEQQSRMLDLILSTTPAYFFVYNRQGQYIYASPPALAEMGIVPKETNEMASQQRSPYMPENFLVELAEVFRTGEPIANEFQMADREQTKHYEYVLNPFFDDDQHVSSVVVTVRETTEQKLAQEALWRSQKMESLGILAGGVAHDFNNLLVALMGQTSLALYKTPLDAPAKKHIEKAIKAAERAADLTQQMLAYSGKGRFTMQAIRLNQLIKENFHLFEAVIPKKVRFQLQLADQLPLFEGDAGQMQQVVMNLILNAAEAIDKESGQVVISTCVQTLVTGNGRSGQKTSEPLPPGEYVCLKVQDNGVGMNDETLSKIFDPFFTTKFTGRGLGLAAVLGIVRGHKGGLYVTSKPNEGSLFEVLFPVKEQAETAVSTAAVPFEEQPISGVVLVIDDEASVREAAVDILEMEGVTVYTAASGETGIALYQENHEIIDLVLLDLSMPGLSGHETFQALKQIEPQAKIILSSGYSEEEVNRQFAGEDVADFLAKPFQLTSLIKKIQRHLG